MSSFQESHSHSHLSARQALTIPQNPPLPFYLKSPHLTSPLPILCSQPILTKMQKKLRLSLAATHLAVCLHVLDLLPPVPTALQQELSILSPWLLALGIPLLILISHPTVPGQFDGMLAWAAGALFVSVYRNCDFRFYGREESGEGKGEWEGMCSNSAVAETVFVGLSVGMICKRYW